MPFDVDGAIKAGYSPAEVAHFLGAQNNFDSASALQSGYTPDEIIGHLNPTGAGGGRGSAPDPRRLDTPTGIIASAQSMGQSNVGRPVNTVMGGDDQWGAITDAADQPDPYIGNSGRGTSNDPRRLDNVSTGDALSRGLTQSAASFGKTAMLGVAAPAVIAEGGWNALTGRDDHPVSDAIFQQAVQPFDEAQKANQVAPDANMGVTGKTAYAISSMIPDIAMMFATGGTSAVEQAGVSLAPEAMNAAQIVGKAIMHGAESMRPVILKSATEAAQQVLENGGDKTAALSAAMNAGAKTAAMGSLPMSTVGSIPVRAATGFGMGVIQSEAERGYHNLTNPDQQQPFDLGNTIAAGASQGLLAGTMGHPTDYALPTRAELGYEKPADSLLTPNPETGIPDINVKAIAEAGQQKTAQSLSIKAEMDSVRSVNQAQADARAKAEYDSLTQKAKGYTDEQGNSVPPEQLDVNEQRRLGELAGRFGQSSDLQSDVPAQSAREESGSGGQLRESQQAYDKWREGELAKAQTSEERAEIDAQLPQVKFNEPAPEVKAQTDRIAEGVSGLLGIDKNDIHFFEDHHPDSVNGMMLSGKSLINTSDLGLDATQTALHEGHHVIERIAEQHDAAGLTGTPAQKYRDATHGIFDDLSEAGKRNYIAKFLYKGELNSLTSKLEKTGAPRDVIMAQREAFIRSKMADPKLQSEMAADFVGNRASDREFLKSLSQTDPKGFKSVVGKWLNVVHGLLNSLRGNGRNRQSKAVDSYLGEELQKHKDNLLKALVDIKAHGMKGLDPLIAQASDPSFSTKEKGVIAEVAPHPGDKDGDPEMRDRAQLTKNWNSMSDGEKLSATRTIGRKVLDQAQYVTGQKGWHVDFSSGTFEGKTNPNMIMHAPEHATREDIAEMTKVVGHMLDQKAMISFDESNTKGDNLASLVKVELPKDMPAASIEALREHLRGQGFDGDTLRDGGLFFGNWSGKSDAEYKASMSAALAKFDSEHAASVSIHRFESEYHEPESRDGYLKGTHYESNLARSETGGDALRRRQGRDTLERIGREISDQRKQWTDQSPAGREEAEALRHRAEIDAAKGSGAVQYGKPTEGSVSALGYHYSKAQRSNLDSSFFGDGLKGLERERLNDPANSDIKGRINFYVDNGKGIHPEDGVGAFEHRVNLQNLYDTRKDPLGLIKNAKGATAAERSNVWERAILKAGYDGYLADTGGHQSYAVLIGKHAIDLTKAPKFSDREFDGLGNFDLDFTGDYKDEPMSFRDLPEDKELTWGRFGSRNRSGERDMLSNKGGYHITETSDGEYIVNDANNHEITREYSLEDAQQQAANHYNEQKSAAAAMREQADANRQAAEAAAKKQTIQKSLVKPTDKDIADAGLEAEKSVKFGDVEEHGDRVSFELPNFVKARRGAVEITSAGNGVYDVRTRLDSGISFVSNDSGRMTKEGAVDFAKRQVAGEYLAEQGHDINSVYRKGTILKIAQKWMDLAKSDNAFKFKKTDSKSTNFIELAHAMGVLKDYDITPSGTSFNFKRKSDGKVFRADLNEGARQIEVCTMKLAGSDIGTAFYAVMGKYAQNKGLRFKPDDILSTVNTYRRTEQAFSFAIKTGDTGTLLIGPQNRVYGYNFAPKTKQDHYENISRLALANYRNVKELVPDVDRWKYDGKTDTFTDSRGHSVEDQVDAAIGNKAKGIKGDQDVRALGIGRSTLARAVLTRQIIHGDEAVNGIDKFKSPVAYSIKEDEGESHPLGEHWGDPAENGSTQVGLNPKFKAFAKDTQALDANGNPRVVYHATNEDFSIFDKDAIKRTAAGKGFWFSSNNSERGYGEGEGGNVMPVFLSIKNPARDPGEFRRDQSFDGLIYELKSTPGITYYAVRESNQIKSAIGNNGDFDASNPDIRFAMKQGPTEEREIHNYLVPETGDFKDGNIAHLPALAFQKDGINRQYPSMPVRIRVGEHRRLEDDPLKPQYGLQHRIENEQKNPNGRGYQTPDVGAQPEQKLERAVRDITLGVLASKTAYADNSPTKIYLHDPDTDRMTVLQVATDAKGQKFWSVITSQPNTRETMLKNFKAPTSVVGTTLNGERTQQALDIRNGMLDKLKAPDQSPVTTKSYTVNDLGNIVKPAAQVVVKKTRSYTFPNEAPRPSLKQDDSESKNPLGPAFSIKDRIDSIGTHTSDLIDDALAKPYDLLAPMSAGTTKTRAIAQDWINKSRQANWEWNRLDAIIANKFSKEQRAKMWDAADEQNELLSTGQDTTGKGLDRLTPDERAVVEQLHNYGEELLQRAKDVGLFKGEGVPYWTPRMIAMIDENGDYVKPSSGQQASSTGRGRNFTTTSSNLKQRKYLSSVDTEEAMMHKGGVLVHDIRTMPLAMGKLENAIAGRELINQIKELGKATGTDMVSDSKQDGFFTIDHPSFTTFRPRLAEKDGSFQAVKDEDGNTIMDKHPLYINKDFEGPLKAILSEKNGDIYKAYMALKSKAMSAIMFSPLIHNQVILGRALAYGKLKTPVLYFTGHAAKNDPEFMRKMIGSGMVPIGGHNNMLDVGDLARDQANAVFEPTFREKLLDPNESWVGLGGQKVGNWISPELKLGDKFKAGLDTFGDFWHNTLLWNRVGDLQAGIAKDVYGKLLAKGISEQDASTVAAHIANRYAGAIGRENMSQAMHKFANVMLFSKSFNAGNIGTVKDAFYGLPAGLRAQMFERGDKESFEKALQFAKSKARWGLVTDLAATILVTSLVQNLFKDDQRGYMGRAQDMLDQIKQHPTSATSYNPYRLSSTWGNEPDKRDRVDMGAQPNSGRHEYMRLPTGKVVEDIIGWTAHPFDTLQKKLSPLASTIEGLAQNSKDKYGTPIWNPDASVLQKAYDVAHFFVGKQLPLDQINTSIDIMNGKATQLDKDKIAGNWTGLTVSQGNPRGPEGAVAQATQDRIDTSKKYVMEAVKADLKYDRTDAAYKKLTDAGLTPKEANKIINNLENPKSNLSGKQRRAFNAHATDAEREDMSAVQ